MEKVVCNRTGYGGAIHVLNSRLSFDGSYHLTNNTSMYGGGLAFSGLQNTVFLINPGTEVSFVGNLANGRGGAIYVDDNPFTYCIFDKIVSANVRDRCFFQVEENECHMTYNQLSDHFQVNFSLTFMKNSALESGDSLYGGNLHNCGVCLKAGNSFFYLTLWGLCIPYLTIPVTSAFTSPSHI